MQVHSTPATNGSTTSPDIAGYYQPKLKEFVIAIFLAGILLSFVALAGLRIQLWESSKLWFIGLRIEAGKVIFGKETVKNSNSNVSTDRNPFLAFTGESGFRFHPFIDVAGAQFRGNQNFFGERDYFGFRNNFNAYFDPGDFRYIIMTGNSEAVGISHDTTIAQKLEKILKDRTGQNYRVLNLAINSASTANEINYFVNLGFNLKPEFVISHSFITDIVYGQQVPPEFRQMGLFYYGIQTTYSKSVHQGNYNPIDWEKTDIVARSNKEIYLLDGFLKNLHRYKNISNASGGHFIFGLQKFDPKNTLGTPYFENYSFAEKLYQELIGSRRSSLSDIDFIDFNIYQNIKLSSIKDPIHTSELGSQQIAEIYAERIMSIIKSNGNRSSRK